MVAFGARSAPDAYRHCEEVVRRSDSSFASAFWLLPGDQRRAIHAIYAFCRLADDIADDPALQGDRRKLLARWRCELEAAYRGKAEHPVGIALGDTVHRFALPEALFAELLDGVEFDLSGAEIETFDELAGYCHQVASTVGLMLVRVIGRASPEALDYADQMGIAVQLTNILRDIGDDAKAGRIYLPSEDLARFGVDPSDLRRAVLGDELRLLLGFYAERARIYYDRAERALPAAERRGLLPAEAMGRIYRTLLDTLQHEGFPCLERRVRLSKGRRFAIAAQVWLEGRGLVPEALRAVRWPA